MKKTVFFLISLSLSFAGFSQVIPYTNCDNCWNADSLGNHKAVIQYTGKGSITKATIPWRRRDHQPELKRIIVQDGKTGQKINNTKSGTLNREYGEIFFEPVSGSGLYYVYYMPYKNEGRSNYPKGVYLKPEKTASAEWLKALAEDKDIRSSSVKEFQSIDAFNSFYPMEVIATKYETNRLKKTHSADAFLIYPEDRLHPIKMTTDLPDRWIEAGPANKFTGTALRGENFAFQLGIYALKNLDNVTIKFTGLVTSAGKKIPANNMFCINTNGTAYDGNAMTKIINVDAGKIQALWCGINVPENATSGIYTGKAIITAKDKPAKEIQLKITVENQLATNNGVNEPWKMTRLTWLNSTLAQENTVIAPYTPLVLDENTIQLLGRHFVLNDDGLPKKIQTFFTPEMTEIGTKAYDIIDQPFQLIAEDDKGKIKWENGNLNWTLKTPGTVKWQSISTSPSLNMQVNGAIEFDGFVNYTIKITAKNDIKLKDIRLEIPLTSYSSKFMMGLGHKGGLRPENYSWK